MTPHRVAVLALAGVYPLELGIPSRVLGASAAEGRYEVLTCTIDGRPVRTNADFSVAVEHDLDVVATADTVIVLPFFGVTVDREAPSAVADALRRIAPGTRLVSFCTGAFVLAAVGLLDGRRVTTHWAAAARFRRWYPQVGLDANALFIDDGDVLTAAGATSGIDLALHIIRRDHGSLLANAVARECVAPPWRDGGQAQYINVPSVPVNGSGTAYAREWALRNLHAPVTVTILAEVCNMSPRTFSRRFSDEVGISPGRWITQQRVERARYLLESTDLSVEDVAGRVGFSGSASLREHLHTAVGVSPRAYRHTFHATSKNS